MEHLDELLPLVECLVINKDKYLISDLMPKIISVVVLDAVYLLADSGMR